MSAQRGSRSPPRREAFPHRRSSLSRILGRKLERVRRTEVADRDDVAHHSDAIAMDVQRKSGRLERPSSRLAFAQIEDDLMRGARRDKADRAGPTHDDRPMVM